MFNFEVKASLLLIHLGVIYIFANFYKNLGKKHFNGISTEFDYFYFASTIQSTVGFGDITPKTTDAKKYVMVQQLITIVLNGIFIVTSISYTSNS